MYCVKYVRKAVESLISVRAPVPEYLLDLLGKTHQDLYGLFNFSQTGWNLFKRMVKVRDLRKMMLNSPEILNLEAVKDIWSEMFTDAYMSWEERGSITCGEITYLTKFFSSIIIKSAPTPFTRE